LTSQNEVNVSFIGSSITQGALGALQAKVEELSAYIAGEELDEETTETYDRVFEYLKSTLAIFQRSLSSPAFGRSISKISHRMITGVVNGGKRYFLGTAKKGKKHRSIKVQTKPPASPILSVLERTFNTLKSLGKMAHTKFNQRLITFISDGVIQLIESAGNSFRSSGPQYRDLATRIHKITLDMQKDARDGKFNGVLAGIGRIHELVKDKPIYFNGISIFQTQSSEDSGIIRSLQIADRIQSRFQLQTSQGTESPLLSEQVSHLSKNLTISTTLFLIFPILLQIKEPILEGLYAIEDLTTLPPLLYPYIEKSSASWARKNLAYLIAKLIPYFFHPIIIHACNQLEKLLRAFIETPNAQALDFTAIATVLSYINAAHVEVADKKQLYGRLDELIAQNLEKSQSKPSPLLYAETQKKLFDLFAIKFPLTEIFWKKVWQIDFGYRVLNLLFSPFQLILGVISCALLYGPELAINTTLKISLRIALFRNNPLPIFIAKKIDTFARDYARTIYPINVLLLDHLQKLWDHLRSSYHAKSEPQIDEELQNPTTKESLECALKHLFEVLDKIGYTTPEQLIKYLRWHYPLASVNSEIVSALLNQSAGSFAQLIASAVRKIFSIESKERIVANILLSVNRSFNGKKTEAEEQAMNKTQKKINVLLSQLLALMIRRTVERRYSFAPDVPEAITRQFYQELTSYTRSQLALLSGQTEELNADHSLAPIASGLREMSVFMQDLQLTIRSNPELPKNARAALNLQYTTPILEMIDNLRKKLETLQLLKDFRKARRWLDQLVKANPDPLTAVQAKALVLDIDLLKSILDKSHPLYGSITTLEKELLAYIDLQRIAALVDFSDVADYQTFKTRFHNVCSQIPEGHKLHAPFNTLETYMNSGTLSTLAEAKGLLKKYLDRAEVHKNCEALIAFGKTLNSLFVDSESIAVIDDEAFRKQFQEYKSRLRHALEQGQKLIDGLPPLEHFNIRFISTGAVHAALQNFAYGRMIVPIVRGMDLVRKPYAWQYGVINPLCQTFLGADLSIST